MSKTKDIKLSIKGVWMRTCSLPSSLRANFTLPMLPAPMVLPKIHLPDCVGMVVRDLDCLALDEA